MTDHQGWTLAEVMVTGAIAVLLLLGLASMSSQTFFLLRAQQQTNAALTAMQERLEQVRNFTWPNLLAGSSLQTLLQDSTRTPVAFAQLPGNSESVTVAVTAPAGVPTPSPAPSPAQVTVSRSSSNVVTGGTQSVGSSATIVQITSSVSWLANGRTRTRSIAVVLGENGVGR
jgi:Tfp pilus assembly protein PilE